MGLMDEIKIVASQSGGNIVAPDIQISQDKTNEDFFQEYFSSIELNHDSDKNNDVDLTDWQNAISQAYGEYESVSFETNDYLVTYSDSDGDGEKDFTYVKNVSATQTATAPNEIATTQDETQTDTAEAQDDSKTEEKSDVDKFCENNPHFSELTKNCKTEEEKKALIEAEQKKMLNGFFGEGFCDKPNFVMPDYNDSIWGRIKYETNENGDVTCSLNINPQDDTDRGFDTAWGFSKKFFPDMLYTPDNLPTGDVKEFYWKAGGNTYTAQLSKESTSTTEVLNSSSRHVTTKETTTNPDGSTVSTIKINSQDGEKILETSSTSPDGQNVTIKYGDNGEVNAVSLNNEKYTKDENGKWLLEDSNPPVYADSVTIGKDGSVEIKNTAKDSSEISRKYTTDGSMETITINGEEYVVTGYSNGEYYVNSSSSDDASKTIKIGKDENGNQIISVSQVDSRGIPQEVGNYALNEKQTGVSEATLTQENGWEKNEDGTYTMSCNGYNYTATIDENGHVKIKGSNHSLTEFDENGKLIKCDFDTWWFGSYEGDEIKEENGIYTIGRKQYIVNKQGLLEEYNNKEQTTTDTLSVQETQPSANSLVETNIKIAGINYQIQEQTDGSFVAYDSQGNKYNCSFNPETQQWEIT